ncbi:MAG: hypothetical protein KTR33_12130 [Gammaproteobacteria bacterium]|nr:hypothetical protein [Gammaproteobacteria bacterium]
MKQQAGLVNICWLVIASLVNLFRVDNKVDDFVPHSCELGNRIGVTGTARRNAVFLLPVFIGSARVYWISRG